MEVWKDIPGYEGLYQASNQGKIRSLDISITEKGGKERIHKGKLLKRIKSITGICVSAYKPKE